MISSSSDGYIKLWGTSLENEGTFALGNHIGTISFKNPEIGSNDIPTSTTWMYRKNTEIVAGYVNSPSLIVYNAENVILCWELPALMLFLLIGKTNNADEILKND